ncbi:MAG: class I SAM-dependent methyltransferase [Planctomycetota bacterium]
MGESSDSRPGPAPEIVSHYEEAVDEAARLTEGHGLLELVRVREILLRYLPPPPADVIDVGGAAGIHSLWLARRGYSAHLLDPVPGHVELARRASEEQPDHPLAEAVVGDARDLPFEAGSADAALLFGPMYHLTEREDRLTALSEARRALRPGGVLLAAAISRFASALDGLARRLLDDPEFRAIVARDLEEGQHRNPTDDPEYFTTAFFHHPDELADEVREAGFEHETTLGVEGPAWILGDLDEHLSDPERRDRLLDIVRRIEREPTLLGASAHLLAVGRKVS